MDYPYTIYAALGAEIEDPSKALVISDWYRDALGGFDTTHHSGHDIRLEIRKLHFP